MALTYLAASCIAAFAFALIVTVNMGSILFGILAYSGAGTLLLCFVLASAFLRSRDLTDDADHVEVIPAE